MPFTKKGGLVAVNPRLRPNRAPSHPAPVVSGAGEKAIALAIGAKPSRSRAVDTTIPWDMPLGSVLMMELQGLTNDGRLVKFWDEDYPVPRVNRFISHGRDIKDGKYLLAYRGRLITAHCGNGMLGDQFVVTVQVMSNSSGSIFLPREQVEPMLFGYVVPDEVAEAKISQTLRDCLRLLRDRDDTPSRQRGHI